MQEQLREIEGTLARSSERKSTILYKLAKRRAEADRLARLGVKQLPRNPHAVTDVRVVRHILFTLKRDLGTAMARLRHGGELSIERDGEAVVRACNDEVNALLSRRRQWEARLAVLTGHADARARGAQRKVFIGCARALPEAAEAAGSASTMPVYDTDNDSIASNESSVRAGDEDASTSTHDRGGNAAEQAGQDDDDGGANADSDITASPAYQRAIHALVGGGDEKDEAALVAAERVCEAQHRHALPTSNLARGAARTGDEFVLSYVSGGVLQLPSEDEYRQRLLDERRRALQARVAALRRHAA